MTVANLKTMSDIDFSKMTGRQVRLTYMKSVGVLRNPALKQKTDLRDDAKRIKLALPGTPDLIDV